MRHAAASVSRVTPRPWFAAVAWVLTVVVLLIALPAGADEPKLLVSVSPLDGQTVAGQVRWEVEVADRTSGRMDFAIDGKELWTENKEPYLFNGDSGMLDTTKLTDGRHTLEASFRARGRGGRGDEPTERLELTVIVANRKPELRVSTVSPANGQTLKGRVKWEAAVEGATPDRVDFAIDGVVKTTDREAPFVYDGTAGSLDTTQLSDGSHTLTVTAADGTDGGSSSVAVLVANATSVPPTPTFSTNLTQGMTVTTPFTWRFSPGDPSVKGFFWADGSLLATVDGPGPYTWTLPLDKLGSGSHTLGHSWQLADGRRKSPVTAFAVTVANGSTAPTPPPAPTTTFSTNLTQGMTVKTPFTWTFSPGDPSVKGFFWADGSLLATVDGPGPYTWKLPLGLLTEGEHVLGHSWQTASGQRKNAGIGYSVTVVGAVTSTAPPPPPPSGPSGGSLPQLPPAPPATSSRVVQVDTVSELSSAFSNLRAGDRVVVEPGTYPNQQTIKGKRLTVPAQIVFKPGARLTGGARSSGNYVGLYVSDSDNVWFSGGDFSDPEGDAIRIDSSTNIVFDGAVVHDSGDSCIMVAANVRDNRAIWLLNVETYRCGSNRGDLAVSGSYPAGYWRKGTHGIYYGSGHNGYNTYGGAIVNYYGHDQPNGSILQVGNGARGLVVTGATLVRAMGDPSVYAGSAMNFWGSENQNVLWVNTLVYRTTNHIMQTPGSTQGPGSVLRALMYGSVSSSILFEQNTSNAPTIGQLWNADPRLGAGDVPAADSPAVGKADPAYLWSTDRRGKPRSSRTLGAFEPAG